MARIKKTYVSGTLVYPLTIADAVYDLSIEGNPVPLTQTLQELKQSSGFKPITSSDIDTIYNEIKKNASN